MTAQTCQCPWVMGTPFPVAECPVHGKDMEKRDVARPHGHPWHFALEYALGPTTWADIRFEGSFPRPDQLEDLGMKVIFAGHPGLDVNSQEERRQIVQHVLERWTAEQLERLKRGS